MRPSDAKPLPLDAEDILEVVREPLLVLDADLRVRSTNPSFCQLFAVDRGEAEGQLIHDLANGQWNIAALNTLLLHVVREGSALDDLEVTHAVASGGRKVMLLHARRIPGSGDNPTLILLTFEDISERRRLDDERRELEARFAPTLTRVRERSIFPLSPQEHVSIGNGQSESVSKLESAQGVLTESERRFQALATASGAVLYHLSADWSELQPLDGKWLVPSNNAPIRDWFGRNVAACDHVAVRERIAHAIATKTPFEMEHRTNRPDGSVGWAFSRAVPLLDARGQIMEWVGAASDVTERRMAEEALRESEERFRLAMSIGTVGVLFFSLDGRIHEANPTFARMSGYSLDELRATTDWSLLTDPAYLEVTARTAETLAATGAATPYEKQMVRKDGTRWWGLFAPTRLSGTGRDSQCVEFIIEITPAKEAEQALRESEERFRLVVEHSPQSTQLFWPDGRTRRVNAAFTRLFGITLDQLNDYNILQDPELARLGVTPLMQRAFAGEAVVIDPIPYVTDRGEYAGQTRWVGAHAYAVTDNAGRVGEVVLVHFDVTERKRAEEGLRRAHDTFYDLIQNNPFGIYVVDADFRLRQVSLGAQKVFAGVQRPLIGRDFAEVLRAIWAEPFASEAIRLFRHTLETGEPYASPRTVERREDIGEVEAYDWRMERITLPDGRCGVVCYFYDLSERQRWEAALRASEERHRRLIDTAYEGIWTIDAAGRTTYVNRRMAELLGYALEEMMGRVHTEFMWEQDRPKGDVEMDGRRRGIAAVWDQRYRRKGGGELWTVASCSSLHDADGTFVGALGMFTDITDRKRAEAERQVLLEGEQAARAEAERAGRMKDEFLATLSHELRTPLNAILGWAQILRSGGSADPEDLEQGLETIERNARAQTAIIEDLLDMSRIISGKVRLDVQPIDLPPIVQAAVETVRPAAEAKGVRLQVVLDPLGGPVSGDPNRLQQVFWNLLTNAVKFTPRGGRVQVLLERVDSHLEVNVTDTGEGITPEFLPFVFDRFRQSDASTTRRHGGLGLGLAIVKQLVEMHGGSITAKSPGSGQGSTFSVSFPLTINQTDTEETASRRHPTSPTVRFARTNGDPITGMKVLVVDDEPDAREIVKRLLEDCGAIVIVAASAAEAFERVKADRPDVIVSDIGMPHEDGFSLIRRVRALAPEQGGDTQAVALTAYARAEDRMNAVVAGFQHHVAKPVEPAELITMVASLGKKRQ